MVEVIIPNFLSWSKLKTNSVRIFCYVRALHKYYLLFMYRSVRMLEYKISFVPVVQRIEREPSKLLMWVRFLPGTQN